ncbi:MAG: nucleotidyltransferase family protein [Chloracidobacterium sp.]|nr:nucleotidyltransferase family protein [Chloracidobacterium sp.]
MIDNSELKIGAMLLAAGGSSRLGQPKQLLRFHGTTLLRHTAEMLTKTSRWSIVVVLGADFEAANAELAGLEIHTAINENWQTGMSSSIKCGLTSLINTEPELDGVVIALCDQPFVTAEHIDRLVRGFTLHRSPITAAKYDQTAGVPALFARELFGELRQLSGDKGARLLIRNHPDQVHSVTIEEAAFDIDTPGDVLRLTSP